MTKYEELMSANENLTIEERSMINDGLYADGCIWLKESMTSIKKACVLAEELGHYHTTVGNILDQNDINSRKQERTARKWAYEKLVPIENIQFAFADGHTEIWDMAEYLDLDEEFLREALIHYGILDL